MITNTKRVLVTGGAGFLGSNLCERLLQDGNEVVCLDNFSTGVEQNIARLKHNRHFRLLRHDITEDFPIRDIPDMQEIYNLACPASPAHYQKEPLLTLDASVLGIRKLFEYAARVGAKVLQASTSEIYGDPQEHPQKETYRGNVDTTSPRACYDEGKRAAETYCMEYRRKFAIPVRIARIFNTYGPMMRPDDGRVISNFIVQTLRKEPVTIYGTGEQTRSFCFVDDLIGGLIRLMASDCADPVNLGNPEEHTIREIAEIVIGLVGTKNKIMYKPLPQDDPARRCPDITRAKTLLEWEPQTSLTDGLRKTITYFNEILHHA
jgi:UDP-glucuronate decarboxylase